MRSLCISVLFSFFGSCEQFIEVDVPSNQLITKTVFEDDLTARAAVLGLYAKLGYSGGPFSGGFYGFSLLCGLSADELAYYNLNEERLQFYENAILETSSVISTIWNESYSYIYYCNILIEGVQGSKGMSPALRKHLEGEGKFLRAFIHFYLVNLFGKVPYIQTTEFEKNTNADRMDVSVVYSHIIADLREAKTLLAEDYSLSNGQRSRVNKFVAAALLSKVYLFNGQDSEAELEATEVIDSELYSLASITEVFNINSQETLWQLENEPDATFTRDGQLFVSSETISDQSLTDELVASFDPSDYRLQYWVLSYDNNGIIRYAPYKYRDSYGAPSLQEISIPIRLGEIYLIRAEARAKQNKLSGESGAEGDINAIRDRAGLPAIGASQQPEYLGLIKDERRHELFAEWGARWLDLKRSGDIDAIMAPLKVNWESTDRLYPIPREETLVNINMPQNPGY